MSARATLLSVVAIGILGAASWAVWSATQAKAAEPKKIPEPPAAKKALPQVPTPMVATNTRPAPKPQHNPRDISLMTRLPDGTYVPNLNGVRQPMSWTGQFSPIVSINRTDVGVDWWVHENGLQSTVLILEGTMKGVPVREATLLQAFPMSALPTDGATKKN